MRESRSASSFSLYTFHQYALLKRGKSISTGLELQKKG
jgi:hypothetical protein